MASCRHCRFETELDDVVVAGASGACICLRRFGRETGIARPMPQPLRRELSAALATLEPA